MNVLAAGLSTLLFAGSVLAADDAARAKLTGKWEQSDGNAETKSTWTLKELGDSMHVTNSNVTGTIVEFDCNEDNVARDHGFSAIHSLSDRPRPEEPWPKDRSDTLVLTVLLLSHDMYAAILLPASFVVLGADRIFFAEADGVELAARDAGVHEIVLGGFGARITESDVVFG